LDKQERFISDLRRELSRARTLHPTSEHLTVALVEEFGELAEAMGRLCKAQLENWSADAIYEEAKHVACVAGRIAIEGDSDFFRACKEERMKEPVKVGNSVIINGHPQAGKDTFAEACVKELAKRGSKAQIVSSVDRVKEAARVLGWNGVKDDRSRAFLSDLKDIYTKHYNGPYYDCLAALEKAEVTFMMIREPEEIKKIYQTVGSLRVLVTRLRGDSGTPPFSNHADRRVNECPYDVVIHNTGSIEELEAKAVAFVEEHLK